MAKNMAVPSHWKLFVHQNFVKEQHFVPKNLHIRMRRKCYSGSCKVTQLSWWNVCNLISHQVANLKAGPLNKGVSVHCCCLRTLINPIDGAMSDWVSVVNQVLLMASMFLAFTAGVIPSEKHILNSQKGISKDVVPEDNSFSGSAVNYDDEVKPNSAWDVVKSKLMDSLYAVEHGGILGDVITELEQHHAKRLSSLCAISEIPRLRLLWGCFQCLKQQVDDISENSATESMGDWLLMCAEIIQKSCQPVCMAWLEEELCRRNRKPEKAFLSLMVEKLNGYDAVLQNIRKLGKEDLFAELISILRFGFPRKDGCYDYNLFALHGVAILEDLVITVADGIASMYLELISVDSSISIEMNSLGLSLCTLSTRALQKLRNEIALNQWLHQNMEAVVSMYEDRFDLSIFQSQLIESRKDETEKFSWWKRLGLQRSESVLPSLHFIVISYVSIPVKRTKELRSLTGWRYYFSLILELADITMPLIRTLIAKVSDAISFFLVCLIGRSLGLIYTGIRQCLRWK